MWGDLVVKVPTVLHLDICEKNLELISSRNHIHMARSKDYQRAVAEVSLSSPARFAGSFSEFIFKWTRDFFEKEKV